MNFDTVVLFDVENLLGNRKGWEQAATELSFGDIIDQLRRDQSGLIGDFAVSRAYANWSLPELSTLRREMTENGVEPRQIFAFDAAGKKNAADIELVIDALDLAYSRPGVSTFVLVTRDGGFASLGRKLHELGKAVVICADAQCSKSLRAVADAFVQLPAPEEGLLAGAVEGADLGPEGEQLLDKARADVLTQLDGVAAADRTGFNKRGVLLEALGNRLKEAVPRLPTARSAYPGLREFLQWATVDSRYCVFRTVDAREHVSYSVGMRSNVPKDATVLPALERRPPQVSDPVALYRLLASQGKPLIRLPEPETTAQVLRAIAARGIDSDDQNALINQVADDLDGIVTTSDVKNVVVALARHQFPTRSPSLSALRGGLLAVVREKLEGRLETVDDDVLQRLVQR